MTNKSDFTNLISKMCVDIFHNGINTFELESFFKHFKYLFKYYKL